MIFFIDYENVHMSGLRGLTKLAKGDEVLIFCRENDVEKLHEYLDHINTKALVKYVPVYSTGKNSLDFAIVAKLGTYHNRRSSCIRMVVSNDKGYDAALEILMREKILCCRGAHIDDLNIWPYFKFYGEGETEE